MRQSKCHPPCKERRLPLEEQAHPEEIPLAPREGRRKGLFSNKDPHRREHVRYANEGVAGGEVGRVSRTGQTDEAPRTGVKGEFFGKQVVRMEGARTKFERSRSGRYLVGSNVKPKRNIIVNMF